MQVQDSYLKSVQDEIEKEYGSLDAFLEREMGLDKVARQCLRDKYLEPKAEG